MGEMGMGELPSPELAPPPVPSGCTPPPSGDDLSGVCTLLLPWIQDTIKVQDTLLYKELCYV